METIAEYISKDEIIHSLNQKIDIITEQHKKEINKLKKACVLVSDNSAVIDAVNKCKKHYLKKLKASSVVNNRLKRKVERITSNHKLMQDKSNKHQATSLKRKNKLESALLTNRRLRNKNTALEAVSNDALLEVVKELKVDKEKMRHALISARRTVGIWRNRKETTVKIICKMKVDGLVKSSNQELADRCFIDVRHFNNVMTKVNKL